MSDQSIGGLAIDDPIRAVRARQLLASAAKAVDQFEDAIRELVEMRAWTVLGYANLADMWEAENGFKCPTYAKVLAVDALRAEGMDTRKGSQRYLQDPDGHRTADIADYVGLTTKPVTKGGKATGQGSGAVSAVFRQRDHGVPPQHVTLNDSHRWQDKRIEQFGTKRPTPKRMGKSPDELVSVGINVLKRDADSIAEIARKASVPNTEIYRQAVTQYLDRLGASKVVG